MSENTPEQLQLIRNSLFKLVHEKYVDFIKSIKTLPIDQAALQSAYLFLDTGILWAKEGILYGGLEMPAQPTEPEPEATVEEPAVDAA